MNGYKEFRAAVVHHADAYKTFGEFQEFTFRGKRIGHYDWGKYSIGDSWARLAGYYVQSLSQGYSVHKYASDASKRHMRRIIETARAERLDGIKVRLP